MMNDKQKSVLLLTVFGGMVLLILIGYFYFILGRGMINQNKKTTADAHAKIEQCERELQEIASLLENEAEILDMARQIEEVARRLPTSVDAPGFLDNVRQVLEMTSIVHQEIVSEVRPELLTLIKDDKLKELLANKTTCDIYTEIPYVVRGYGRYHALGQFLNFIEQNPKRFMRLRYLRITNNDTRPSMHPVEVVMATFMFNSNMQPNRGGNTL